ncbi:MAG: hypothetical protein ABI343_00810, partial [Burkholderiaceae bacterium]
EVGGSIVGASPQTPLVPGAQDAEIQQVFALNMGIFKIKFTMYFLMNLMHHLGVATALGVGGYYVVKGRIDIGTVVAFVSGLAKVNDPWGDLVDWFREMTLVRTRYRLLREAVQAMEQEPTKEPAQELVQSALDDAKGLVLDTSEKESVNSP